MKLLQTLFSRAYFEHIELTPIIPFPLERHHDCEPQKRSILRLRLQHSFQATVARVGLLPSFLSCLFPVGPLTSRDALPRMHCAIPEARPLPADGDCISYGALRPRRRGAFREMKSFFQRTCRRAGYRPLHLDRFEGLEGQEPRCGARI